MEERIKELLQNKYVGIALALIVGAIFISVIGVPNPDQAYRTDKNPGEVQALPEEGDNPDEAGWWWQNNGGGNSSW